MPQKHYGKWRARWVDHHGERQSKNFDEYRDANFFEKQKKAEVEEVKRGMRAPTPPKRTFDALSDEWLATRAKRKRSGNDDYSIIHRHLKPSFGALTLDEIGVAEAERFIAERAHLAKKTVHNLLTLLIAMLNYAHDLGWLLRVPRIKKPRVRIHGKDYQYLRTDAEIRRLLAATEVEGPMVYALYATAVYTGAREGELAGLRWEDVNFDTRLITIQRSFDGPTKAEDVRHVPILDVLLPTLREWRLRNPLPWVFPSEWGNRLGESSRVFQEVLHRVLARAEFPKVERGGKPRAYIRFHDLRHSFASHWMMKNGDLFRLQKILGHKSAQMTQRYAHLSPGVFVEDFGRFGSARSPGVVTALVPRARRRAVGT